MIKRSGQARATLGIDSAWTQPEPSGVALVVDEGQGWRLVEAAASYDAFLTEAPITRHRGSTPNAESLLAAAKTKAGCPIDIVAVDMPLSTARIVGRRVSDNLISSLYGARHAGTHTPSAIRPGSLSDDLRLGFEGAGYPLATSEGDFPCLIEVYPHPALIELASAGRRLAYKHSKIGKYWPEDDPATRRVRLFQIWGSIVTLLNDQIASVADTLPLPATDARGYEMKAFEDTLDAVVCAWIGACVLDGKAKAYGDQESAIWVPKPR